MSIYVFLIRIVVCFILASVIGIERQFRHGMVGLRTNVLVSMGAFLFMIVSFGVSTNDETRIAAQIVSGIGFLGAGVIMRDGNKVKGLNTAATLWCVASIGVMTACGMITYAFIGTFFVLLSNIVLRFISMFIMDKINTYSNEVCTIYITCDRDRENGIRNTLARVISNNNLNLTSLEKNVVTKNDIELKAVIVTSRYNLVEDIVNKISVDSSISLIKWDHVKFSDSDNGDNDTPDDNS